MAESVAIQNYTKKKSNVKKVDCDSEICLIFPCDEEKDLDESLYCKNGCHLHVRCEGLILIKDDENLPEDFECEGCKTGTRNKDWLKDRLEQNHENLDHVTHELNVEETKLAMKISKLEEFDSKIGPRQRKLKESMKIMKLNPAKYHGGDFEGKAIQELLECVRNKSFEIIECIADKPELYAKFKRAFTTLREVSDTLRLIKHFNKGQEIESVKLLCEKWGEHWTVDFPHLNMTPKGHDLVFVIPKILEELQTYHMFYKMEEKGESIHAELNDIERKIWCIRKPSDKLWKYIERYELRNILEIDIVNPLKRVNKTK
jgi:hypothetical protein